MRVDLPGASVAEVELDVQPRGLLLRVPGRLRLDLPLPLAVRWLPPALQSWGACFISEGACPISGGCIVYRSCQKKLNYADAHVAKLRLPSAGAGGRDAGGLPCGERTAGGGHANGPPAAHQEPLPSRM